MKPALLLLVSVLAFQTTTSAAETPPKLSSVEMEDLVAPIALYPDPLLGLILPASVFPDQIVDAALLIKNKSDAELIAQQSWDASVKGVATYPGVLKMMHEKIDWTTKLGDAFLNQSDELRHAIQGLRVKAQSVGNLKSTEEQQVTTAEVNGETVVRIEPTTPEVVYVPQYTQVVYTEPVPSYSDYLAPVATFGLGMALGAAIASDHHDDVYVYGGYPGRVAWYDHDEVDHWMDNRQDMIRDSQNHRQEMQKNRTEYRQGMGEDRQNFRQQQIESGNVGNQASREQFRQEQAATRQQQASSARENRENYRASVSSSSQAENYRTRDQQAQQRAQEWKGSAADRGYGTASSSARQSARASTSSASGSKSSAFQGYSSRSAASAYSSRGSASRSAGGSSRGGGGRRR